VCCRRDGCAVRRKTSTQNNASASALVSNHRTWQPIYEHYKGFFAEVRSAAWNEGYIGRPRSPRASRSTPSYFWPRPLRRLASAIKIRIERWIRGSLLRHAGLLNSTRRVLVKALIVRHRGPRSATLPAHVGYLKCDCVTRTGKTARMFTQESASASTHAGWASSYAHPHLSL
jgi:hypothetical protein